MQRSFAISLRTTVALSVGLSLAIGVVRIIQGWPLYYLIIIGYHEYGLVLISDIAKKVLAADRSPERVNLYEIMAKPVLSVPPEMSIKYCAKLLERFSIMRAPVIRDGIVVGVVSFHDLVLRGLMELCQE